MQKRQSLFLAGGAVLLWSSVATVFKITLSLIRPTAMLAWAILFSLLSLTIIAAFSGKIHEIKSQTVREWGYSALLGFLNPILYYLVLFNAYDKLPAQLAQTLNYTWPAALILLAIPILKKKPGKNDLVVLVICYAGAVIIASRGSISGFKANSLAGILLAICSSLLWAIFWLFNTKDKRDDSVKLFSSFTVAAIPALIYIVITKAYQIPVRALAGCAYIGFFEMGFTFYLWSKALEKAEHPATLTSVLYLSPFISLLFIRFILGEPIYPTTYPGLLLICLGLILQNRKH